VIAIIALLMGILMPALNKARQLAVQLVCGTNLKGLGGSILVYATSHDEAYPRAGGPGGTWSPQGTLQSWSGFPSFSPIVAYGIILDADGNIDVPGRATITSSLYLLIKFCKITPKNFVCRGDYGAQPLDPMWVPPLFRDLEKIFDFFGGGAGIPFPGELNSYGYQMPYSFDASTSMSWSVIEESNPSTPVLADRNPHLDKNAPEDAVNSACHFGRGQNVLYKDGSVVFEHTVTVGIKDNNIYTYDNPTAGTEPVDNGEGFSLDDTDAYLVSEKNWME
jgi:hypothetical protein